jgi:Undecaprenyl-phosphate glucose phosphotransferase
MLKQHAQFFKTFLILLDLALIAVSWVTAYYLRMSGVGLPLHTESPSIVPYLWLLFPILVIWGVMFHVFDLYRPRRLGSRWAEFWTLLKANTLSVLVLVAVTFFLKQFEYSRLVILYFWGLNVVWIGVSRALFREGLRVLRRRGYNQRSALIVGAGQLGQRLVRALRSHPELGIRIEGLLTRRIEKLGTTFEGIPHLGTYQDLPQVLKTHPVDQVFLCLPLDSRAEAEAVQHLQGTMLNVTIVPAIAELMTLRAEAEMFEGMPVITLQGTPLLGWNVVLKRLLDLVGGSLIFLLTAPLMLVLAAGVKLSSPGPILYRQTRMGLDGRAFEMLKFRSMRAKAEDETGPVWAREHDQRRTGFGTFLRRTSLDELPQFINVLKGEMSIVGPRPERPEFIVRFCERIPQYMLRHKMKAGITGWAQVNGWRGNTSLEKRIEYDLYYIEHWSLWFDLKIMLLTLWKGFLHKHAY